jgi:phenylpropionate dioxygenase-like ring-hydroxylating dioxygenase large terminal subunit
MARLVEEIEQGWTLPAEWYSDPAIFRLERQRIFRRSWQWAGHLHELPEPGSFLTCRAGDIPVVLVRDRAGDLRAFVNVCRHRGHLVVQGSGRRETLQCPYHAWTYDLDGTLRAAPRSEREPSFDPSALGLLPVQVATWGPLVFVNPDLEAGPLADTLGELPAIVAEAALDFPRLRFRARSESVIAANWKIVVENFLECYHCPVAHPGFSRVIDVDPESYRLEEHEWFSSQIGPLRSGDGDAASWNARGEIRDSHFHFLWPNFTLNVVPGPPNMAPLVFLPLDAERTLSIIDYYFAEDVSDEDADAIVAFGNEVGQEDQRLVESVHAGLRTGMVRQGRLLLSSEHLIQHFQRLVARSLA